MAEDDVISLSSSSRPSSPFINISEVFNDSEKRKSSVLYNADDLGLDVNISLNDYNNITMQFDKSPQKYRTVHNLSDSDDCSSTDIVNPGNRNNDIFNDFPIENTEERSSCQESLREEQNLCFNSPPKKQLVESRVKAKLTKEQRLEEKERKRKEKEQLRFEKRAVKELQNQMKPGNCMKYMTAVLDSSLVNCPFGGVLLAAVQNSESKYEVSAQDVPFSICWIRDLPGSEKKEEEFVVLIWQWQMFVPAVKNHTLCFQIQEIQSKNPNKSVSLVVYGLNGFFSYLKSKSRKGSESSNGRKRKQNLQDEEFPYLTKNNIEEELIELQIMTRCNHRLIETQEELGQLVVNITKAIAETPYKLDKQRRELENLEWFAVGDSRDCVAVDKAGNGLLRLWQQQLCQFNMAGHDVAQAIAKTYPSPVALMQAYDKCSTKEEGEGLLRDILIRRCQGPIGSSRRIGPELSKKIYTFFYSSDGDVPLSQEKC